MTPLKASIADLIGRSRLLAVVPGDRVQTTGFFQAILGPKGGHSVRKRLVPAGSTLEVVGRVFRRKGTTSDEVVVAFPYDDKNEDAFCIPVDIVLCAD